MPVDRSRPLGAFVAVALVCAVVVLVNMMQDPHLIRMRTEAAPLGQAGPQVQFGAVLSPDTTHAAPLAESVVLVATHRRSAAAAGPTRSHRVAARSHRAPVRHWVRHSVRHRAPATQHATAGPVKQQPVKHQPASQPTSHGPQGNWPAPGHGPEHTPPGHGGTPPGHGGTPPGYAYGQGGHGHHGHGNHGHGQHGHGNHGHGHHGQGH